MSQLPTHTSATPSTSGRNSVKKEAINVVCRIRPLNQLERMKNSTVCVSYPASNSVAIGGKVFTFDVVLQPNSTQTEVYERTAKSIVESVLNGYNGTIFAYGQTASGKTYTMEGKLKDPEYKGVIPRIIEDIFLHIERMDENLEFLIKVSYLEIYLEKIKDLLDISKTNLSIHESKDHIPYVKGATERFVSCADDVLDALDEGKINRHVSVTNMNEHSSRSHSIFIISIQQNNRETGKQLNGSLYLVDLAGSEKISKTGAEGSILDEAKNINKSLSTLGNVINALVEGNTHIPYRDSKLTRILQQSLGGNSKTTIIIAASPASFNENETKSTFVFGIRAKTIKNQVTLNAQLTSEEWRRLYEKEIDRSKILTNCLSLLDSEIKKWRNGERVPKDSWLSEDCYGKFLKDFNNEMNDFQISIQPQTEIHDLPSNSGSRALTIIEKSTTTLYEMIKQKLPRSSRSVNETSNEENVQELFRILDEKDDEINKQCQIITKIENQLLQLQTDYTKIRHENEKLQTLAEKLQNETESRQREVKEVLQALEELAITYDDKNNEVKQLTHELEITNAELEKCKTDLENRELELAEFKISTNGMKQKLKDLLLIISNDLSETGSKISKSLRQIKPKSFQTLEEQVISLKLYVIQMKTEAELLFKNLNLQKSEKLPLSNDDSSELRRDTDRKIKELQSILNESDKIIELRNEENNKLKTVIDNLNYELSQLKSNYELLNELNNKQLNNEQLFTNLNTIVERNNKHYHEQIVRSRGDYEKIVNETEKLRQENVVFKFQIEHLMNEIELIRQKPDNLEPRLYQDLLNKTNTEQVENEIKGIEETVTHELQILQTLRRIFLTDLKNRIKKNANKNNSFLNEDPLDAQNLGTSVQREKIIFLKNSLDNLTKVHKQLVRDNAELRCDIPKLEKRVKASSERIKDLEFALRESKEQIMRDKKKYQFEIERIRESTWTSGNTRLKTNIVKPIRAGQTRDLM